MLPEQLWDADDLPDGKMKHGDPTGSAMPLCWSHAEYVSLVRSHKEYPQAAELLKLRLFEGLSVERHSTRMLSRKSQSLLCLCLMFRYFPPSLPSLLGASVTPAREPL